MQALKIGAPLGDPFGLTQRGIRELEHEGAPAPA
jgi:hypothetical protein